MINNNQSGFTVIELLITLFIAVAFLVSGYQLYNVIIKTSGDARAQARAINVANDFLKQYESSITNPCTAQTPLDDEPVEVYGLSSVTITVTITCPYSSSSSISKVDANVTYGIDHATISSATMFNSQATPGSTTVTSGLVGWWKFNGNMNDSSDNGNNGSGSSATLTTGQDGSANGAYNFSGTSYINMGTSSVFNSPEITFSAWVKPTNTSGVRTIISKETSYKYRLVATTNAVAVLISANGSSWLVNQTFNSSLVPSGDWAHVAVTISSSDGSIKIYVNSNLTDTGQLNTPITSYSANPLIVGSYNTSGTEGFVGAIDDARVYNRALSASEIANLYLGGAY